ncbi:PREDICTED: chymotrypsinogen B-like [Condylura cristata]|uniref:chymotrypsinogen B-like n=1 Tax=Condylura cristata TaxID=143302 RepID=UPI0006437D96|nr:PREDICTED: chymotrypsinogen B-like [Condylura cristata]
MAFPWLLPSLILMGASFGSGAPASDPELSITPRIINGTDARPGAWPWHVSLQTHRGDIICGGSLINRFWVITAAHCNITKDDLVIAGLYDRRAPLDRIQILNIAQVFVHPMYNVNYLLADIALLKLSAPARLHATVSPALLPTVDEQFFEGTQCAIMGWGDTHPNNNKIPVKLQQATVRLVSKARCKQHWGRYLSDSMMCAAAHGTCNCDGDSGSPLICPKDGFWKLAGIVCFGSRSYNTRMPTVYTRVTAFRPWIEEVLDHN